MDNSISASVTNALDAIRMKEDEVKAKRIQIEKVKEEVRRIEAETRRLQKDTERMEIEDNELTNLLANEMTELLVAQIDNSIMRKQLEREEAAVNELDAKLKSNQDKQIQLIEMQQNALNEYLRVYGKNGSAIQEAIYAKEENEKEVNRLKEEKEKVLNDISKLKRKEKHCIELEKQRAELLKELNEAHNHNGKITKEIQALNDEIKGIDKQFESLQKPHAAPIREEIIEETRVTVTTTVETRQSMPTNWFKNDFQGFNYRGPNFFQESKERERERLITFPKKQKKLDKWLIEPTKRQRSGNSRLSHVPATATAAATATDSTLTRIGNETIQEIADTHNMEKAPLFLRALMREAKEISKFGRAVLPKKN